MGSKRNGRYGISCCLSKNFVADCRRISTGLCFSKCMIQCSRGMQGDTSMLWKRQNTAHECHISRYTDGYSNLCTRDAEHPNIRSTFFQGSHVIDAHNQCQQHNLALEKKWLTKDAFFRLAAVLIEIHVVYCDRIADFHQFINFPKKNLEKKWQL